MQIKIYAQIEISGEVPHIIEIINISRDNLANKATLGVSLTESKTITNKLQIIMTKMQIKDFINGQQPCDDCGKNRSISGHHNLTYRTLFGKLILKSPRLNECKCKTNKRTSFSPLAKLLTERISPELSYLEAKWASLVSYGMTVNLLEEVLPINTAISSVFNNAHKVANRLEKELEKETNLINQPKISPTTTCITVGIDGGYIPKREGKNRKAGFCEVILGKTLQQNSSCNKRFGFVKSYNEKPKQRLSLALKSQGLSLNQITTFLSDGADNVRDLPNYLNFDSEHILDWFHISMHITQIKHIINGLTNQKLAKDYDNKLHAIKEYLWYGLSNQAIIITKNWHNEIFLIYRKHKLLKAIGVLTI